MPKRTPVQYTPGGESVLAPVASPTSVAYTPKLPRSALYPAEALAGLSDVLAGIAQSEDEKAGKKQYAAGATKAEDIGPDVLDQLALYSKELDASEKDVAKNQKAWARRVNELGLPEMASPWGRTGAMVSRARRVVAAYNNDLTARLKEVGTVLDDKGLPVEPKAPDEIIAETWAKYADNGALSNYYGGKAATELRATINEKFRADARGLFDEAMTRARHDELANNLGAKFDSIGDAKGDPTPDDLSAVDAYVRTEMHARSVRSDAIEGIYRRALTFAALEADKGDDGRGAGSRASRALQRLKALPFGTTTVGADVDLAAAVDGLIEQYDRDHERKSEQAVRVEDNARKLAGRDAERKYGRRIVEALQNNQDPLSAIGADLKNDFDASSWGEHTPDVYEHIRKLALSKRDDQGVVNSLSRSALLDEPDAAERLDAAVHAGFVTAGAADNIRSIADKAKDIGPLVERHPGYGAALSRAQTTAGRVAGLQFGAQASYDLQTNRDVDSFRQAAAMVARGLTGSPAEKEDAMREWYLKAGDSLNASFSERAEKVEGRRQAGLGAVLEATRKSQDASRLLDEYRDVIPAEDLERLRRDNARATDTDRFFNAASYARGEAAVDRAVRMALDPDGDNPSAIIETAAIDAVGQFKGKVRAWLSEHLSSLDPAQVSSAFDGAVAGIVLEAREAAGGKSLQAYKDVIARGATPAEAKAAVDRVGQSFRRAQEVNRMSAVQAADALTAVPARDPHVPEAVYSVQRMHLAGDGASRDQVLDRVDVEARALMARTDLPEDVRSRSVAEMYRNVGVPIEDLAAGRLLVKPSDAWRARLEEYVRTAPVSTGIGLAPLYRREPGDVFPAAVHYAEAKRALAEAPLEVKIKPGDVDLWATPVFRTPQEASDWYLSRHDELKALLRANGVATDDATVNTWMTQQEIARRRVHGNAR